MIYRLEIENFYSMKERQVIDLRVGKKVPEELGRLMPIHDGAEVRAPRVVAIYGANGSGKSNVLRTIVFLTWFTRFSFGKRSYAGLPCPEFQKFQTKEMVNAPARLSVTYPGPEKPLADGYSNTCPYTYTIKLSARGDKGDTVLYESLCYRPTGASRMMRIFARNASGDIKTAKGLGTKQELSDLKSILRPDASLIATLDQINSKLAHVLLQSVKLIRTNTMFAWVEKNDSDLLKRYADSPDLLAALNDDICRMDLGIDQVEISSENGAPVAKFTHRGLDQPVPMPLESHGAQKFLRIYPILYGVLKNGGIAVVDEIDSSIHPEILLEILRWFSDEDRNPYGAQLWMTCHDSSLLNDLLKEEVLICEKNRQGETQVYRLADIEGFRKGENLQQYYLGGVYGGVPSIG